MKKNLFLFLILISFISNINAFVPDEKKGSISITKTDSEKINRKEASLENSEYGLYNNKNELITTIITDINGKAYVDNISYGMYFLKEIVPSKGYNLNVGTHTLIINDSLPDWYIYTSNKIIEGKLIINKYYSDNVIENNSEFEIYDVDNELVGSYKTLEGKVEVLLPYGTYKVVEKSGVEGYKLIESFNIKINEEKNYVYDLYAEKIKENIDIPNNNGTKEEIKTEEDSFIVEVPDTYKFTYNKIIIGVFVILGSIFILFGIKKLRD